MRKPNLTMVQIVLTVLLIFVFALPSFSDTGSRSNTLRMALLSVPDVLPAFVAEHNGYFEQSGIRVEMLPVGSGLERDQLMQAGRVDGMLNELSGTASFNRKGIKTVVVASARRPISQSLFRILGAPKAGLTAVDQLRGVDIAVSKNTIIEYITDRLLEKSGFDPGQISTSSVPVLPERLQLLLTGRIKAATLPDPLAESAVKEGATVLAGDIDMPDKSVSVLTFSKQSLADKPKALSLFIRAWMRAARDLNADPELYRSLMLKKIRVPGNVRQSFKIPAYPVNEVPDKAQWDDVIAWMIDKKMIDKKLDYAASVTDAFLRE